jgi:hypothetical protein
LLRLVKQLPSDSVKSGNSVSVPFSLMIRKKCIKHGIDTQMQKTMHLYDLQCLLIQFEIEDVRHCLEEIHKTKLKQRGISGIRHLNGNEALKFLTGGQ